MKLKRALKIITFALVLCLAAAAGLFLYNSYHVYNINSGFTPVPLSYNPDDSSSSYIWNDVNVTVHGGFVKGIQKDDGGDRLVIRALSPLPTVTVKTNAPVRNLRISIENISPSFYSSSIDKDLKPARITVNTLEFSMDLSAGETKRIIPAQPSETADGSYVILGDSRDGYETFGKIIDQVNALKPAFVIDNGDLVYSGKPNQYKIFDEMTSGISATLCTTLGNHDIRGNGRETYQKLYGPEYYSFDFGGNHFAFLDSSRGYAEKQAIPDKQYAWLERDLQKAQGKRIYVISHVPPADPRSGVKPNEIQAYTDKVKKEGGFVEQKLEAYSEDESIDHGFQTKQEAERFENLMTKYKVDMVYLSHIHSYFDYTRNGVRYLISGGAGAELMTQNSYYHYLIAKAGSADTLTLVQLPSLPNLILQRYAATVSLFVKAMYQENQAAAVLFIVGFALLVLLLLTLLFLKLESRLAVLWILVKDTGRYMAKRQKELHAGKG
ncbi:metallophosphoesterase [Caproiciproducens sp. NJN-50]|uniref:metallophosphoesterase family protein n=1 Tax=Acutalibacteraceae TaxID=3082771 RepID=UPI000FFE23D3|nr:MULTISPECIES: metallophosphoesterase [Acutalibacteraceae]QAT50437.1 metallophosphoesterase [Caproiciproducens sp. NJN-50]